MKPKIFAMYLPQYHSIPENDAFWGNGFTDWVAVRNAKPLFEGHQQPRVPEGERYYDLSQKEPIAWQAKLAKDHGISGFGIYHYWFNDEKNLLTKPAEIIRDNKDIDIDYFFAWDNISWKRTWSSVKGNDWCPLVDGRMAQKGPQILIEYRLGGEASWRRHFDWLLPYFKDNRYVKVNDKPMFVIFHYDEQIRRMATCWNAWAQEAGFGGMHIVYRHDRVNWLSGGENVFEYEPASSSPSTVSYRIKMRLKKLLKLESGSTIGSYDKTWQTIIEKAKDVRESNHYPGAFVDYDDTARRGGKARIYKGFSLGKFKNYLKELLIACNITGKRFVFLTAWNEWGEGAYLEPDTLNGMKYLDAVKAAMEEMNAGAV